MKAVLFLSLRYLFKGKSNHISFIGIISIVGIAIGVASLIVVISVMNGFDRDLMKKIVRANYHIVIEAEGNYELNHQAVEKIKKIKGVENIAPFVQTQIFAAFKKYIIPLRVKGIDFNNKIEKDIFSRYVAKSKGYEGFFIGKRASQRYNIKTGDKLFFYPLKKKLQKESEEVSGIFEYGFYELDSSFILCSLDTAKRLSPNFLLAWGVRLDEPLSAIRIKKEIMNILGEYGEPYIVRTWIEDNQSLFSALKLEKITMFIILSLIIIVACFNIFAILTVKVVEKIKDIGILKAIGFNSFKIGFLFSLQGLILGFLGVFSGSIFGLGICFILKKYHFVRLPADIYYIEYLPVALNYRDVAVISLLAILMAFLFSLIPSVKAAHYLPSEALRYE